MANEADENRIQGQALVRAGLLRPEQLEDVLRIVVQRPGGSLRSEVLGRGWVTAPAFDQVVERPPAHPPSPSGTLPIAPAATGVPNSAGDRSPTGTLVLSGPGGPAQPPPPADTVLIGTDPRPASDGPTQKVMTSSEGASSAYASTVRMPQQSKEQEGLPQEVSDAAVSSQNLLGKYILIKILGAGGMGVVWKAWDRLLRLFVVLKFLQTSDPAVAQSAEGQEKIEELLAEARLAVKLNHPNIARVYELGEVQGRHYMAQYYIDGSSLDVGIHGPEKHRVATHFYEDPRRFVTLLRDISLAMGYAHELTPPIIHRDLKPLNVMLDRSGRAYVVDFGLAKELKAGAHSITGIKGSPKYMAPEQVQGRGSAMDARTDIWALGVILYEMLTGRGPFEAPDIPSLAYKIVHEEPRWPRHVAGPGAAKVAPGTAGAIHVPPLLEQVAMKCIEKDRRDRYPSARALAADLDRFLVGDPVPIQPSSVGSDIRRWGRRLRKYRWAGMALLVVAGLAGVLFGSLGRTKFPDIPTSPDLGVSQERLLQVKETRDRFLKSPSRETLSPLVDLFGSLEPVLVTVARQGLRSWWQEFIDSREAAAHSLHDGRVKREWLGEAIRAQAEALNGDLAFAREVLREREKLGLPERDLTLIQDCVRDLLAWKGTITVLADLHPWATLRTLVDGQEFRRDASRQENSTPVRITDIPVGTLRLEFTSGDAADKVVVPGNALKDGATVRVWGTLGRIAYKID